MSASHGDVLAPVRLERDGLSGRHPGAPAAERPHASDRGVLRRAGTLYAAHWRGLAAIALTASGAVVLVPPLLTVVVGPYAAAFVPFFYLAGAFWVQGALVAAVEEIRRNAGSLTVRRAMEVVSPKLNTLSAVSLIAAAVVYAAWSLPIVLGAALARSSVSVSVPAALLVVPGLVILGRCSLVVPAIMLEDAGVFRSFARSASLVRGQVFRVLFLTCTTAAILAVAWLVNTVLVASARGWLPGEASAAAASALGTTVAFGLATPFVALAWTLLYHDVRTLHAAALARRPPKLRVGDILDVAWNVYKKEHARCLGLAALVFGLIAVVHLAVASAERESLPGTLALTVLGIVVLQGPVAVALADRGELRARDLLRQLRPRLGALVAAAVFAAAAFWMAAFLAGVPDAMAGALLESAGVPGIALSVAISLAVLPVLVAATYGTVVAPALVLEGCGLLQALTRSRRLVAGNGRRAFRVLATSDVLATAVEMPIGKAVMPEAGGAVPFVVEFRPSVLIAPYVALAWTLMYFQLRDMSETRPPGERAS